MVVSVFERIKYHLLNTKEKQFVKSKSTLKFQWSIWNRAVVLEHLADADKACPLE
jgi:hypothetical protein